MELTREFKKSEVLEYQENLNSDINRKTMTAKRELRRLEDIVHIKNICPNGKSVLCIGARDDSEVLTFKNKGYDVNAIDVCTKTSLIKKMDMSELEPNIFGKFDIIYCSHVLEHVMDPDKTLKAIKSIANNIIFIILPIVNRKPDIEHPTVFDIMKHEPQTNFNNYPQAFLDFRILTPFNIRYNCYRNALTEEYEIAFIIQRVKNER